MPTDLDPGAPTAPNVIDALLAMLCAKPRKSAQMSLSAELGAVIGIVYEAAASVEAWPSALTAIADVLNAGAISLTIIDKSGAVPLIHVAPRTAPLWRRTFIERWSGTNFVRDRGLKRPVGHAYQFEDLLRRSQFERTAFYKALIHFWCRT